jgi:hypothetical protein
MTFNHDTDDFMTALLDAAPIELFEIDAEKAQSILDNLDPDTRFYESLRDAFRDNIDAEFDDAPTATELIKLMGLN